VLLRITNTPRPYAWGSTTAIAELLGREPSGQPEAELWLGSHPGSPARVLSGSDAADLRQWAETHAPGGRLPFLLKVLAASAPLSLQVHPTAEQAREGFARENAAGISPDDPVRNYKDDQHKPELIVAVSDPFRALCGFRPVAESRADLAGLRDERLEPLLHRLVDDETIERSLRWLLDGDDEVRGVVAALSEHAAKTVADEGGLWLGTVRMLAAHYPGDPGVAISTLLRTILLRPGEALYLPAGNIHAYVDGVGIELMAASDNVLRGGLTPKHVDVTELLRVADLTPLPAPVLVPEQPQPGIRVYRPGVPEFRLTMVESEALDAGALLAIDDMAIALVLDGAVEIHGETLERGEAALVTGATVELGGHGRVVVATGSHPEAR
jgi:mannose-6-phosphate isomerase